MAHARRSLRNHHDGYHAPGDPLGVYLPPLSEWRVTETGAREWVHPRLGWLFRVMKRSGNVFTIKGANVGSVYFRSTAKSPVYDQIKAWYASLTVTGYDPKRDRRYPEELSSHMYGARRSERNPDWSAIRAKASRYGSRAATGARDAYQWTAPRAKRAAEVTWEGAKSAGRAVKRGAKRAAPVVARGARSAAESMERWSQTNGRCAMRNGAALTKAQTDALVEAYAKYKYAGRKGAPMKVQQRFYDRYDSLLGKALEKFGMRIAPQEFTDELDRRADKWLRERPVVGAGTFW